MADRDSTSSCRTWAGASALAATPHSPNHLLAALSTADFELLRPNLKTIELEQGAVLVTAGERLTKAFFPLSGVVSLVVTLTNGDMIQVAMVGRDSVFGTSAALDGQISLTDLVVQLPGTAATLDVNSLRTAAESSIALRAILNRHEQALFAEAQQTAACNASHSVEARLARWLLRMHDLSRQRILPLTQEFLGQMMGIKRNSISLVAHEMQNAGIIKYSRGHIEIIDLPGLEEV